MKHASLQIAVVLCAAMLAGGTAYAEDSTKYRTCTAQSAENPQAALKFAEQWQIEENTPSSIHCKAISLFALKRYREAAAVLQELSKKLDHRKDALLWGNVLRQASRAWELSGNDTRAIASLTYAINTLSNDMSDDANSTRLNSELLLTRSNLYRKANETLLALQDLDHGLSLQPTHQDLLLARAELFVILGQPNMAKQDAQLILRTNPNHAKAKLLLSQLN